MVTVPRHSTLRRMTGVVALYVRISSDPLNLRAGVERQLADCETIAKNRGWAPTQVFEDNDRSAWSGKRPAFEAMLEDIRCRRVVAVIAWDMDRLVRQPRDLERFLDTCADARLTSVLTAQGDIDLTSHDGQLHARILAAVAKKESDDKSRRVRRALTDKGERGLWRGGSAPWGYAQDKGMLTVVPEQADVVRRAAVTIIEGGSLRSIVEWGVGPVTRQGWRSLLLSPTIAGITHTGHRAVWEPIIDDRIAANLKATLENPSRLTHKGNALAHWVSGLLFCGSCNGQMGYRRRERNGVDYSRFVCVVCQGVSIIAKATADFIEGAILEAAPTVSAPLAPEPIPPKGDGVPLGAGEALTDLAQMYARGDITRAEWLAAREVAVRPEPIVFPVVVSIITDELWNDWGPSERRRAAHWLLSRVLILPALVDYGGDLADRIEFEWVR